MPAGALGSNEGWWIGFYGKKEAVLPNPGYWLWCCCLPPPQQKPNYACCQSTGRSLGCSESSLPWEELGFQFSLVLVPFVLPFSCFYHWTYTSSPPILPCAFYSFIVILWDLIPLKRRATCLSIMNLKSSVTCGSPPKVILGLSIMFAFRSSFFVVVVFPLFNWT